MTDSTPPRSDLDTTGAAAWGGVQRIYESFEQRAHAALDASRMRAGDVLRPAVEAVVAVPRAVSAVLRASLDAAVDRIEDSTERAQRAIEDCGKQAENLHHTWETAREAAEAQRAAALASIQADHSALKRDLSQAVLEGHQTLITVTRRTNYLRAFAIAAPACLLLFGAGIAGGYWWGSKGAHALAAVNTIDQFRDAVKSAEDALRQEAGLLVRANRTSIELLANSRPAISALAGLGASAEAFTALSAEQRADALAFGRISDDNRRKNMLAIATFATGNAWWGDTTYSGCVANGPVVKTNEGNVPTCLVALPSGWRAYPDTALRAHYGLR
ncbi:hypothetical protein [Roseomonas chloroacetimidivorans]|uniref:hypothetical protein n=1 Tax=Roseomonas chloroacetimidivorans TaxID=1766656 RepID=UPI003C707D48